jgi:uncharacterized protein
LVQTVAGRPALAYFALTFLISWAGVLVVVRIGHGGMPATPEQLTPLLPYAFVAMLAGPVIAGPLLIGLIDGKPGLREFRSRLFRSRVGVRWCAVALFTAPLMVLVTLLALSLVSVDFLPELFVADAKVALVFAGIAVGLVAGLEELGWTGFAVPRLRRRHDVLTVGLLVGLLWGAWHVPVTLAGSGSPSGSLSLAIWLPPMFFYAAVLPGFRVLMVWVYDRSESLLVAILMHASLTGSALVILQPQAAGTGLIVYYLALATGLWAVVWLITAVDHNQRRRPSSV